MIITKKYHVFLFYIYCFLDIYHANTMLFAHDKTNLCNFEWCLVGMPKYFQKHHGTSMVNVLNIQKNSFVCVFISLKHVNVWPCEYFNHSVHNDQWLYHSSTMGFWRFTVVLPWYLVTPYQKVSLVNISYHVCFNTKQSTTVLQWVFKPLLWCYRGILNLL